MPRLIQVFVFFLLVGISTITVLNSVSAARFFAVLLSSTIFAATVSFVLPWVYYTLRTEPVSVPAEG